MGGEEMPCLCILSGFRCYRCQREREEEKRQFYELMDAVWRNDIAGAVQILARNPRLAVYRRFTFHLPAGKTTSILDYTLFLNHQPLDQVLIGFGATPG